MKKIFTLLLALFCTMGIWAENVTEEQALEQALEFLTSHETTSGRPHKAQGQTPQLILQGKVSGLYVFNVEGDNGFVIVSNDDRTLPILGFSESCGIDINNIPDNMRAWLQGYADEIAWLQAHDAQNPQNASSSRNKARNKVGTHSTASVAPLLKTTWNQGTPYNNLCPTYSGWGGSGRCATGCVATAMAQVMKYHEWPQAATSTIPGYTTYTQGLNLSSLPAITFDWAHMKNSYSGSYNNTEANAVATLMKYCGYSVKMDYDESSGAYTEDVATALVDYFDYNPYTTRFVSRSSFTYENWTDLIYYEVSHNRPVCYGGLSDGGGHEFVCDGYKFESNTDFFHINWGWGGLSDNYFVLSALDPDQQGIGGSTSTDGFRYGQDAVIGIQRSTATGTVADISPNIIDLTLNSITLSQNTVEPYTTVDITFNITNNSVDPYDGDIWLCLREADNDYLLEAESVVIPSGTTQDVVISYTPRQVGTYDFTFCFINAEGAYDSSCTMTATLTVKENLTNGVVPVYGYWTDNLTKSQFIIPIADIEDMTFGVINSMTFTAAESSVSWGTAKFDVYVKEVDETTLNSLKNWTTLEKVYSGSLSVSGGKMVVNFDTPYQYMGGNLLVGFNQTQTGSYSKVSWYGETVSGVSIGGYGSSVSQQNFLPAMTFDFTPSATPIVRKPKNLVVSYDGGDEAIVSWTSDAAAFDIEVNGNVTEDVDNPCTLTGLEYATTYYIKVRAKDDTGTSDWTDPVSFTTDLAADMCQIRLELTDAMGDGWNGAAIIVVDVLSGIELGTFTNTNEAKKGEAQVYYVEVPDDRDIEFQWVKSAYDHECSYAVYDVAGNEIFSGSKRLKTPVTYHVDCHATTPIILSKTADNTDLIESLDGTEGCTVILDGHSFFKDGTWNTICLPFDVVLAGSPLDGADLRALSGAVLEAETVTLNFTGEGLISKIKAGRPYIIRWNEVGDDIVNPVFTDVTIDKTVRSMTCHLDDDKYVTFKGTYAFNAFTEEDRSVLFVENDNLLCYPLEGATIGAHHAYFQLDGITADEDPSTVKQYVMNLEEDDPTALTDLKDLKDLKDTWFDLSGKIVSRDSSNRKLHGVFIKGNKTIFVK